MFKNVTPGQIAAYCSGLTTAGLLSIFLFLHILGYWTVSIGISIVIALCFYVFSYFINNFFIKRYIFRRIKPIYKLIHDKKVSAQHDNLENKNENDLFDLVSDDVASWANEQENTIRQLQMLENYRRDFLGNVSHELKTPIFNIQGYVHTLMDGAMDNEQLLHKYLDRTAKNIDRLQTIVEDLESISKLELGEQVLELQKFDIKKLTEEVFEHLEMKASEKNIKLLLKDGANQSYKVLGDKEYIRQVLTNLTLNSIKYGKENGITKVGFYNMDTYLLIEVADNGIGIEKQHLNHLFDRFYRVDPSRSRIAGGSGLGLSIVKHIMEAHQQTISVRSTPNEGSTFGFTLQLAKGKVN